jgi:formate dehydrogenase (NADP+) beta subunit
LNSVVLTIDGNKVETQKGTTVLKAALDAGIFIPSLCHHPNLKPIGACQLCVVEIKGCSEAVTSCTTEAVEGMVVRSKTPRLEGLRKLSMEMMLAGHPSECTGCPKYGKCEFASLIQYLGVNDAHLRKKHKSIHIIAENPLFLHDLGKCVLCQRCVRACRDLRGCNVLDVFKKDGETYIGTQGEQLLMDAACKFCGACAEVCPTGAIRDKEGLIKPDLPRQDALVPCRYACPAHTDVPRYLRFIREKKYAEAVAVIREKAPFPMTLGYICLHPCETACRRGEINDPVSIRDLKRFAAENDNQLWKKGGLQAAPTGKKAAVIGAGPAGLTAAYYLRKKGHAVDIHEAMPEPGGMLRYGVPEYRLPAPVIESEIKEIMAAGVNIIPNSIIETPASMLQKGYDAVLVAGGAQQGVRLPLLGADLPDVLLNMDFLRRARLGNPLPVGHKVVVLGGGNVAFDCARVARRLGAAEVTIACLEARNAMTASEEEITEAESEGIAVLNQKTFLEIAAEQGRVAGVKCMEVESFRFDENRMPQIKTREGSEHTIPADTIIFAVGQRCDWSDRFGLELGRGKTVAVDSETLAASLSGIFAAGDAVTGTLTVIDAIAQGRKAAISMDLYLGGDGRIAEQLAPLEEASDFIGYDDAFNKKLRCPPNIAQVEERLGNFNLVNRGYEEPQALQESERCLQCDLRCKISEAAFWMGYTPR